MMPNPLPTKPTINLTWKADAFYTFCCINPKHCHRMWILLNFQRCNLQNGLNSLEQKNPPHSTDALKRLFFKSHAIWRMVNNFYEIAWQFCVYSIIWLLFQPACESASEIWSPMETLHVETCHRFVLTIWYKYNPQRYPICNVSFFPLAASTWLHSNACSTKESTASLAMHQCCLSWVFLSLIRPVGNTDFNMFKPYVLCSDR